MTVKTPRAYVEIIRKGQAGPGGIASYRINSDGGSTFIACLLLHSARRLRPSPGAALSRSGYGCGVAPCNSPAPAPGRPSRTWRKGLAGPGAVAVSTSPARGVLPGSCDCAGSWLSKYHSIDSVKAILMHRAHRLLSESTRILCTSPSRVSGSTKIVLIA
jgi:hypothetical protein